MEAKAPAGALVPGKTLALQLRALGSPTVLFHATRTENVEAINQDGVQLRAGSRRHHLYGQYPHRIYFSLGEDGMVNALMQHDALFGRSTEYTVFAIDPTLLPASIRLHRDPEDANSFYTETGFVPPDALRMVRTVLTSPRQAYYTAAIRALHMIGIEEVTGEDFQVTDDAILLYCSEPVSDEQIAQANAIIHRDMPGVRPLHIQREFDPVDQPWTEIVGYLE